MVSDSTVHSTSPFVTVLPASLVKSFTVPEPAAYTMVDAGMDTGDCP